MRKAGQVQTESKPGDQTERKRWNVTDESNEVKSGQQAAEWVTGKPQNTVTPSLGICHRWELSRTHMQIQNLSGDRAEQHRFIHLKCENTRQDPHLIITGRKTQTRTNEMTNLVPAVRKSRKQGKRRGSHWEM